MKRVLITISALAIALTTASASDALTMSPYSCNCRQPSAPICCPAAPVLEQCAPICQTNCGCPKCKSKKHHHRFFKKHHKKACGGGCQLAPAGQSSCGCGCK